MKNSQKGSATVILLVVLVVVLAGGLAYTFLKKPSEVAVSPTPTPTAKAVKTATPTPKATVDPTAGWKTYSNEYYGFEIKYPGKYVVAQTAGEMNVSATFNIDKAIQITAIIDTQNNLQLDDFVKAQVQQVSFRDYKKITFLGQSAYEGLDLGLITAYEIIVKNGAYIYQLVLNTNNKDSLADVRAGLTLEQKDILSTFKFTK